MLDDKKIHVAAGLQKYSKGFDPIIIKGNVWSDHKLEIKQLYLLQ